MAEPEAATADVRGDEMLPADILAAAAHPPEPPSGRPSFRPFALAEHHVVEACRSVKGDAVWVAWLGYPKSRNCWRSVTNHFPLLEGGSDVLATQSRVKISVRPATEAEASGAVVQGRKPPASDIRAGPAPLRPPTDRPAGPTGPRKARKREFETRVHTIRVCDDGVIQEIRGVRRAGMLQVDAKPLVAGGGPDADADAIAGASSDAAAAEGAGGAACSGDACSGGAVGGEAGGGSGGVGTSLDERLGLCTTQRLLNEADCTRRAGSIFRLGILEFNGDGVDLQWTFPESSPGDASAWIGMYDANGDARSAAVALTPCPHHLPQ